MTWRNPETGKFLLTTSVALPVKAFNIRRDPHVALLFSDPTGSGLTGETRGARPGHCSRRSG